MPAEELRRNEKKGTWEYRAPKGTDGILRFRLDYRRGLVTIDGDDVTLGEAPSIGPFAVVEDDVGQHPRRMGSHAAVAGHDEIDHLLGPAYLGDVGQNIGGAGQRQYQITFPFLDLLRRGRRRAPRRGG